MAVEDKRSTSVDTLNINMNEYYITRKGILSNSYVIRHGGSGKFANFVKKFTELLGIRAYGDNMYKIKNGTPPKFSMDVGKNLKLEETINELARRNLEAHFGGSYTRKGHVRPTDGSNQDL